MPERALHRRVEARVASLVACVLLIGSCGDDRKDVDAGNDFCELRQIRSCRVDGSRGINICTRDGTFSAECFVEDECDPLAQTGCPAGTFCFVTVYTFCAPEGVYPCDPGERLTRDSRTDEYFCNPFCDLAGHPNGIDPDHCEMGVLCQATIVVPDEIGLCGIEGNE